MGWAAEDDYDATYGKAQAKIRRRLKNELMGEATMGTKAGQWSARKSQELKRRYEAACERAGLKPYKGSKTAKQKDLSDWSDQDWRTSSGGKSSVTGEPYFPAKAVEALKERELYAKAKRQKTAATRAGKQRATYSKDIQAVVARYRAEEEEDLPIVGSRWRRRVFDWRRVDDFEQRGWGPTAFFAGWSNQLSRDVIEILSVFSVPKSMERIMSYDGTQQLVPGRTGTYVAFIVRGRNDSGQPLQQQYGDYVRANKMRREHGFQVRQTPGFNELGVIPIEELEREYVREPDPVGKAAEDHTLDDLDDQTLINRMEHIGERMAEIVQKHGGSYQKAERDPEYLRLARDHHALARVFVRRHGNIDMDAEYVEPPMDLGEEAQARLEAIRQLQWGLRVIDRMMTEGNIDDAIAFTRATVDAMDQEEAADRDLGLDPDRFSAESDDGETEYYIRLRPKFARGYVHHHRSFSNLEDAQSEARILSLEFPAKHRGVLGITKGKGHPPKFMLTKSSCRMCGADSENPCVCMIGPEVRPCTDKPIKKWQSDSVMYQPCPCSNVTDVFDAESDASFTPEPDLPLTEQARDQYMFMMPDGSTLWIHNQDWAVGMADMKPIWDAKRLSDYGGTPTTVTYMSLGPVDPADYTDFIPEWRPGMSFPPEDMINQWIDPSRLGEAHNEFTKQYETSFWPGLSLREILGRHDGGNPVFDAEEDDDDSMEQRITDFLMDPTSHDSMFPNAICNDCGIDVSFNTGLFVNRLGSDTIQQLYDDFDEFMDNGYGITSRYNEDTLEWIFDNPHLVDTGYRCILCELETYDDAPVFVDEDDLGMPDRDTEVEAHLDQCHRSIAFSKPLHKERYWNEFKDRFKHLATQYPQFFGEFSPGVLGRDDSGDGTDGDSIYREAESDDPVSRIAAGTNDALADFANAHDTDDGFYFAGGLIGGLLIAVAGNIISDRLQEWWKGRSS